VVKVVLLASYQILEKNLCLPFITIFANDFSPEIFISGLIVLRNLPSTLKLVTVFFLNQEIILMARLCGAYL
jgi:hypothetical protein